MGFLFRRRGARIDGEILLTLDYGGAIRFTVCGVTLLVAGSESTVYWEDIVISFWLELRYLLLIIIILIQNVYIAIVLKKQIKKYNYATEIAH